MQYITVLERSVNHRHTALTDDVRKAMDMADKFDLESGMIGASQVFALMESGLQLVARG